MTAGPENIEQQSPEQTPSSEAAPSPLVAALQREHPEWVREVIVAFGETTIVVPRESIVDACTFLKTSPETRFDFLSDICGADRGVEEEPRFEVNYHLFSTTKYHRVRLKVLLNEEDTHVPSVTGVWKTATPDFRLFTAPELQAMFPEARVAREWSLGMVKSVMAIHAGQIPAAQRG